MVDQKIEEYSRQDEGSMWIPRLGARIFYSIRNISYEQVHKDAYLVQGFDGYSNESA
jgi:hypothetical protein